MDLCQQSEAPVRNRESSRNSELRKMEIWIWIRWIWGLQQIQWWGLSWLSAFSYWHIMMTFQAVSSDTDGFPYAWVPCFSLKLIMHASMLSCFSHVWLLATLWTIACQAPLSMGFFSQEYWSGLPFPSSGDLPDSGIEPESLMLPALAAGFFTTVATWETPKHIISKFKSPFFFSIQNLSWNLYFSHLMFESPFH